MQRIAILGCGGSGKSTLARRLREVLGLPVVHLDLEFWNPGWVPTPEAAWAARQPGFVAGERWIIDGNFHATIGPRLARADTILHLDFSRRTCLAGVARRWWRWRGRNRYDLPEGCPEKIDREFLRWVWRFRRDIRPIVLEHLAAFAARGGRVVTLRSRRAVDRFVADLERAG